MALGMRGLLHKHDGLSSDPQNPQKKNRRDSEPIIPVLGTNGRRYTSIANQ